MSSLQLQSDQSKSSLIEADRRIRTLRDRLKRAARAAFPFFIGAVVGVFIPVFHFVIVPAALVAMIALAARELTTRESFLIDRLVCPHCMTGYAETEFERLPKRLMCFNCRVASTLSEAAGA